MQLLTVKSAVRVRLSALALFAALFVVFVVFAALEPPPAVYVCSGMAPDGLPRRCEGPDDITSVSFLHQHAWNPGSCCLHVSAWFPPTCM